MLCARTRTRYSYECIGLQTMSLFSFFFFFVVWYEINEECHICIHCHPGPLAALDCLFVCLFWPMYRVSAETIQYELAGQTDGRDRRMYG